MHKMSAMLTVACVLLCLSFNYTFPLRRESSKWNIFGIRNDSQHYCDKKHREVILDPSKIRAVHTKKAIKILEDPSSINENHISKEQANCPIKNTDDDLRHFEQMVIKKKNPYLDLKELELNYYSPKSTRQSVNPGSIEQEPSLCEVLEEGPIVEITNRGLSGFAIPQKLYKEAGVAENKNDLVNLPTNDEETIKTIDNFSKKHSNHSNLDPQLLSILEDDIRRFEDGENSKTI